MHPSQVFCFCFYFGPLFGYYFLGLKYFRETFVKPEDVVAQKVGELSLSLSLSLAIHRLFFSCYFRKLLMV